MWGLENWSWTLDGWIIVAGILCAVSTALLGNFLVLRQLSLLGDAITHAVLPGLAAAFFLTESRSSWPMFLGAVIVGVLTALFTQWIRRFGQVDEGASMGVVFTSLFALGLVMIVQAADHVDLDPGCVLYGAIETTPLDTWNLLGGLTIPRVVVILSAVLILNLLFVVVFFKELKVSSFDPAFADNIGMPADVMHYLLMTLVAVTAVACFESVGNILVVAMFVVPPAAAYLLTDRLGVMIVLSTVLATVSAVLGHLSAMVVPAWFGYGSTTTASMMAAVTGLLFVVVAFVAPRHGVIVRFARHRLLSWQILAEDVIAFLYRWEERHADQPLDEDQLQEVLLTNRLSLRLVLAYDLRRGLIAQQHGGYRLTDQGRNKAQSLVRSHRLWEQYLFTEAGMVVERIHDPAEKLEHFTTRSLREQLDEQMAQPQLDPHGSPIPPEENGNSQSEP